MITYSKAFKDEDLKSILELQQKNLPNYLSSEERLKEGFVTVQHSFKILKKMNDDFPHTIAKHNHKVIGFALSMTKNFASEIAVLKPMFKEISNANITEKYIVMGQICIDKDYRGKGVFRSLYNFMKDSCKDAYSIIITEIDVHNTRSLNAHKSIGFEKMIDYTVGNKNWRIVTLKT